MSRHGLLFSILIVSCLACSRANDYDSRTVQSEMRKVYRPVSRLFQFAWSPTQFESEKNEKEILSLLDQVIENFHSVESIAPQQAFEPGFRTTLKYHHASLEDVRRRFRSGNKDYAHWRLRSLASNCIACHSRYEIPADFIGDAPIIGSGTFEDRLSAAEFLIATRQIEPASNELLQLAQSSALSRSASQDFRDAMKLWLLLEVRTRNRPEKSVLRLQKAMEGLVLSADNSAMVEAWRFELENATRLTSDSDFPFAQELLKTISNENTIQEDEIHLVNTLRATAVLHHLLEVSRDPDILRQGSFLLAKAYAHLPIPLLTFSRELFLEHCIREYPGTHEAQLAFGILENLILEENSGSSGLHLEQADLNRLSELRSLSVGPSGSAKTP